MHIDHFALTVADIEASAKFYGQFGFTPVRERAELLDAPWISEITGLPDTQLEVQLLKSPDTNSFIELLHYVNPTGESFAAKPPCHVGSAHICFVVEDIDAEYEKLVSSGVSFRSGVVTVPVGYAAAGVKAVYGLDPDGYTFELLQKPA